MGVNIENSKRIGPAKDPNFHITKLGPVVLQVTDLESSTAFYTGPGQDTRLTR